MMGKRICSFFLLKLAAPTAVGLAVMFFVKQLFSSSKYEQIVNYVSMFLKKGKKCPF